MGRSGDNSLLFLVGRDSHSKFKRSPLPTLEKKHPTLKPLRIKNSGWWHLPFFWATAHHVFVLYLQFSFLYVYLQFSILYVKDVFYSPRMQISCLSVSSFSWLAVPFFRYNPLPPDSLSRTIHLGLNCGPRFLQQFPCQGWVLFWSVPLPCRLGWVVHRGHAAMMRAEKSMNIQFWMWPSLQGNVEQIDHGIGQGRLCYGLC